MRLQRYFQPMRIARIGVIGAGVIGTDLAQDLAQTGHRVVLVDLDAAVLEKARKAIASKVRLHHLTAEGAERMDSAQVMGRIQATTDYACLSDVDFVVENATEDWEIKRPIYEKLDRLCPAACVFAANTSVIPITQIAAATGRADRVVGMHFMNPVPLKPLVEVIRGEQTSDDTLETAKRLLSQMNKDAVVVMDSPGFVSNRVLMLSVNESALLVQEGVASVADADEVFRRCFGHKMGPLETADLIGLDTVLRSIEELDDAFGGNKFKPCPLLVSLVGAGKLGRKSGEGFYSYSARRPEPAVAKERSDGA
jgi:3-hydroxybutyryl-CoA dehydrogenase